MAVISDPFADEYPAASKAASIAKRCGARLMLVNTFMIPQPVNDAEMGSREAIIASAIRQRRRQIEEVAAKWRRQGIKTKVIVEWDYPTHEAIVRAVLREKPDLLVSHSHRQSRIARWLLSNTDWELMRHCPCALWFARSARLEAKPKIIVAVDPRHTHAKPAQLDQRLLAAASSLTGQLGGAIELVHAFQPPLSSTGGTLAEPFRLPGSAYAVRDHAERLARDVERLGARYDIPKEQCSVVSGDATEVLPAIVKKRRADVIVMGAVSRSTLSRPVIGHTAEKIIDRVDCDVFVVKPARFKTSVPRTRPKS
jgi:universal stress protein E